MTYYKYDEHTIKAADRFAGYYTKNESGCWEWNLYKDADGYGQFTININKKKKVLRAHRFSWLIANQQDWPDNKPVARHICNNPCCVNPDHILPGTVKENAEDAIKAGTQYNGTNSRKRPIKTPFGSFESGAAASRALKIRHSLLIGWLKHKDSGYEYL
jgi:hypothetical protein